MRDPKVKVPAQLVPGNPRCRYPLVAVLSRAQIGSAYRAGEYPDDRCITVHSRPGKVLYQAGNPSFFVYKSPHIDPFFLSCIQWRSRDSRLMPSSGTHFRQYLTDSAKAGRMSLVRSVVRGKISNVR